MQRVSAHTVRATLLIALLSTGSLESLSGSQNDPPTPQQTPAESATQSATDAKSLNTTARALLQEKCFRCHAGKTLKAELDLSTRQGLLKGGESGPLLIPGKPDESLLYEMVHEGMMPPDEKDRLTKQQVEIIRRWILKRPKSADSENPANQITQHNIIPLMLLRCTVCHGNRRREAGLDLRTKAAMLKGGKSGPAMIPGKPAESLILKKIHAGEMPPRRQLVAVSIKPIESQEIELLTKWISAGAPESSTGPDVATTKPDPLVNAEDRTFWAFQPPRPTSIPHVKNSQQVKNPIDAFLLRKLEQHNLSLSPEADQLTLLRRMYFDLIGLPPTPKDLETFLADQSSQAYERLLDRLLDSPRFGEHQSRFWLDLAGYSDSEGVQDSDLIRPQAWRYRDYVIRAFNQDKPYDRFLLQQIAGDERVDYQHAEEITPEIYDNLVATGFLRQAEDGTFSNITGFVPDRMDVIGYEMEILSSSVMGLSLKCARCHSHKFDPIPQRDYYRLLAVFKGAFDEHDWLKPRRQSGKPGEHDRYLPHVTTTERNSWQANETRISTAIAELQASLKQTEQKLIQQHLNQRLSKLPNELHDDLRTMLITSAEKRSKIQKYLAEKFEATLRIKTEELKKIDPKFKQRADETDANIKALASQRKQEPLIRAVWDRGEPSPTYIARRGNYFTPGRLVGPGVLSVLTDGKTPLKISPPHTGSHKSGRRLAFARWLTNPQHPLTARVIVNRVWKEYFGKGIVETLDNFGKAGARPSHPELLDWLALEFVHQGWSIKKLIRLIVTSHAYRQSSRLQPVHEKQDPDNQWYSRMPLKRMRAEVLRDTLLSISNRLDLTPFGPPDNVTTRPDGLVTSVGTDRGLRRSVFVLQRRTQIPTILENFDLPRMSPNCVERPISTVAPQALHLMNNGLIHELGERFAQRVIQEAGSDREKQIERAYLIALNRKPTNQEKQSSREAIIKLEQHWQNTSAEHDKTASQKALANFCHAMINSAAFIYID